MSTLADRIKEAMEGASLRPADLARATKKTSGAVAMWLGGGIKSLKAESAAAINQALVMWRTACPGFFKTTKTAPAMPVQESIPLTAELLKTLSVGSQ